MHGHGKYYYKDSGQIYEGEYYQGKKQGSGRIKYPNQKELEGMFSGGKANGVLRYKKGSNIKDVQMEDGKIKSVIRESQLMSKCGRSFPNSIIQKPGKEIIRACE